MATPFSIPLDGSDPVSALDYPAASGAADALGATLILAHGAGAPQTHPFMTAFGRGLSSRGLRVVTFNFPYMERRRRYPDPGRRLEACYRAVIADVCKRPADARSHLLVGGKSMGGRIATQVVAHDTGAEASLGVDGLVLLGYPLHPPGRPDKLRDAHLPSITAPMLFVQGSRDTFGTPDELRPVLAGCAAAELFVVEGGEHSFKVRGKTAQSEAEIHSTVQDAIIEWCCRRLQ
ncbi:MAG: dienelactone hydrolase [Acidobacteria bacterium]|nr:dienelactone hydrolase [Acidobacteriota bacterium]